MITFAQLIISYDDLFDANVDWLEFEKLHEEFPDLKITFFVITGKCTDEFLKKVKQPWIELVFHSYEHSGSWLNWTKEDAKDWLLKYTNDKYGFVKGFKSPAYKSTKNIIDACNELDFWLCSSSTVQFMIWNNKWCSLDPPLKANKYWFTHPREGLSTYTDYTEFYDHFQNKNFKENIEKLKCFCRKNKPTYKFISEVIK